MYKALDDCSNDNYYIKDQSWNRIYGDLAPELGATEITNEAYTKLCHGQNIHGENVVGYGHDNTHRPGRDFVFSPEKSIALARHFGTPGQKEAIPRAFQDAVEHTVNYAQWNFLQCRETEGGITEQTDTRHMVAFGITHNLTRAKDPGLHQYVVFFNNARNSDGAFRAMSNEKLYANQSLIEKYFRE